MGKIVHFEIPTDDPKRAREFYQKVFGWQMNVMDDMDYTIAMTGPTGEKGPEEPGFINGGIMKRNDLVKVPDIVVEVDSIDDIIKTIEESGGKMVSKKMPVGNMGFTAYFTDTEGNLTGLWEMNKTSLA